MCINMRALYMCVFSKRIIIENNNNVYIDFFYDNPYYFLQKNFPLLLNHPVFEIFIFM